MRTILQHQHGPHRFQIPLNKPDCYILFPTNQQRCYVVNFTCPGLWHTLLSQHVPTVNRLHPCSLQELIPAICRCCNSGKPMSLTSLNLGGRSMFLCLLTRFQGPYGLRPKWEREVETFSDTGGGHLLLSVSRITLRQIMGLRT